MPSRGGSRIPRLSRRSSALPIPIFVCITRTGADGAEFRPPGDPGGTRFSSARKAPPPAPDGRVRDTAVSFPFICVFFASLVGRRPPWRCGGCSCRPSFPREAAPRPLGGCLSHFVAPASNSSNTKAQYAPIDREEMRGAPLEATSAKPRPVARFPDAHRSSGPHRGRIRVYMVYLRLGEFGRVHLLLYGGRGRGCSEGWGFGRE